jgi:hypothetical protein
MDLGWWSLAGASLSRGHLDSRWLGLARPSPSLGRRPLALSSLLTLNQRQRVRDHVAGALFAVRLGITTKLRRIS